MLQCIGGINPCKGSSFLFVNCRTKVGHQHQFLSFPHPLNLCKSIFHYVNYPGQHTTYLRTKVRAILQIWGTLFSDPLFSGLNQWFRAKTIWGTHQTGSQRSKRGVFEFFKFFFEKSWFFSQKSKFFFY